MLKSTAPKKTQQKAPKAPKVQKRALSTKKVAKKVATKKVTNVSKVSMSTMSAPSLPTRFASTGIQSMKSSTPKFLKKSPLSTSFKSTKLTFDSQVATSAPSPAKVIFQAQKFLQQDMEALSKELSPTLPQELTSKGYSYTVNDEGIITVLHKALGFDIEMVFDREFEYADQDDQEEEEQQGDQETDEGKHAFHNITITLSRMNRSLRLGGQMHLNGDLKIQTFTPYLKDGTELRTVSTEDLSDGSVNALFDSLEVTCLSDETCTTLLEIGRQERLKTHLESIDFIAGFLGEAETM